MAKRFEKEYAEAETILSNYKKNLISYFDNPTSYNKLVSALMPIMQEQIKLIDDFRDSSIEIGVEQDITLGSLMDRSCVTKTCRKSLCHYLSKRILPKYP